jgi:hypothetical protein
MKLLNNLILQAERFIFKETGNIFMNNNMFNEKYLSYLNNYLISLKYYKELYLNLLSGVIDKEKFKYEIIYAYHKVKFFKLATDMLIQKKFRYRQDFIDFLNDNGINFGSE